MFHTNVHLFLFLFLFLSLFQPRQHCDLLVHPALRIRLCQGAHVPGKVLVRTDTLTLTHQKQESWITMGEDEVVSRVAGCACWDLPDITREAALSGQLGRESESVCVCVCVRL